MAALLQVLMVPLVVLNIFGAIVSGIWLAVLGQWGAIGIGLLAMFVSSFVLGIAMLPQLAIGAPAVWCIDKGYKIVGYFFGFLAGAYLYALITLWSGGVLWTFMGKVTTHSQLFPMLVWSYGVATSPWSYMASRESQGGDGSTAVFTVLFMQLGYLLMMLMILFSNPTFYEAMQAFVAVMVLGVLIQLKVFGVLTRRP
jgi:hypothetical protein